MTKQELLNKIKLNYDNAELDYLSQQNFIDKIPDSIIGLSHASDKTIFMDDTFTLEELKIQLASLQELQPEVDDYYIHDNYILCIVFITNTPDIRISTYCKDIESALAYYSNNNCILEKVPTTNSRLKCIRE